VSSGVKRTGDRCEPATGVASLHSTFRGGDHWGGIIGVSVQILTESRPQTQPREDGRAVRGSNMRGGAGRLDATAEERSL